MATTRDICVRALQRIRIAAADEASSVSATDVAYVKDRLNDMLYSWKQSNIDLLLQADFELNDTFVFWVPPKVTGWEVISIAEFQSNWDANANSPLLASGSGTSGHVYKVTTAGTTTLDGISSWAVNDFLVFDAGLSQLDVTVVPTGVWRKGLSSRFLERGVQALLALEIADDFGKTPSPRTIDEAANGMSDIEAAFLKPPQKGIFDSALVRAPSNRYQDYISGEA